MAAFGTLCAMGTSTPANAQQQDADTAPPVDTALSVSNDGAIELHVVDMPLATVLQMLNVHVRRNIITTPAVKGTVTLDLYNATFEQALRATLAANDCDYEVRDGFIYVYTADELAALRADAGPIPHHLFWLNYVSAADIERIIEPLLSEDGTIAKSPAARAGVTGKTQQTEGDALAGHDFIVVYDHADRLAKIAALIKETDVKPAQVLVEATILRARLNEENALGVDFTLLGGVDLELMGATSNGVLDLALGALPIDRYEQWNSNASTDFRANVPEGGLSIGIIKDHVALFIRALEQVTDTAVIANPKVIALNKQMGSLLVGRRDGYLTTTVTETQAVEKVEFLETGTQLVFRPFIGTDGYVRMELRPKDSIGGLTPEQLPYEQATEVTANVLVRDGHTILIGGLFREVNSASRSQIPVLGNLPYVGTLFRSRNDSLDREEVIILLTVHIIKDDASYARQSFEQLQDSERIRVGLRRGMMWHGRERMAQAHYREALEHYARGEHRQALWNVQMALLNQPRFLSAIKLKEDIVEAREWDDDGSVTRTFLQELIASEGAEALSPFDRPPYNRPGKERARTESEPD
jgi:type IV pilus assembly protein PilQ